MDTTAAAAAEITEFAAYLDRNAEGFEAEGETISARSFRALAVQVRAALAARDITRLVKLVSHRVLTADERIPVATVYNLLGADDGE